MKVVPLRDIDISKVTPKMRERKKLPFKPSEDLVRTTLMRIARGKGEIGQLRTATKVIGVGNRQHVNLGDLKPLVEKGGHRTKVLFGFGDAVDREGILVPSVFIGESNRAYHVAFGEDDASFNANKFRGNSVTLSVHANPTDRWAHAHHGKVFGYDVVVVSDTKAGTEPLLMFPAKGNLLGQISDATGSKGLRGMGIAFGNWNNVTVARTDGGVIYRKLEGQGIITFRVSSKDGELKQAGRALILTDGHSGSNSGRFIGGRVMRAETTDRTSYAVFFPNNV